MGTAPSIKENLLMQLKRPGRLPLCLIPDLLIYNTQVKEVAVPYPSGEHHGQNVHITGLILLTAVLLLPALLPEQVGWLTSFVPLPIFYYLVILGNKNGAILIRNAILLSAVGAFLIGSMPVLIFSLAMAPLGVVFSHAVSSKKNPVETGFIGFLFLVIAWLLFWFCLGLIHQTNPYTALLVELDQGLAAGLTLYEESAELAPETLESIRNAVELLRAYIPKVLPGILISAVLFITWLNLVLGSWLLKRKDKRLTSWPDYVEWKLPDSLVWLVIVSGMAVFILPPPFDNIGIIFLIICITVYFFQGLAIVASLLNKWSVPMMIRILIYALIFIQTYGIIILSFLGLVDIWADFRKLNNTDKPRTKSV
jgi:uncharacterized protein YybS (DUF2232 family)